jgi:hypothetical protein
MVTKEVWVTCGNDGVGEEESGCSMIGVEAVALPWVVAQHHIGLHNANESHESIAHFHCVFEFSINCAEKSN